MRYVALTEGRKRDLLCWYDGFERYIINHVPIIYSAVMISSSADLSERVTYYIERIDTVASSNLIHMDV